jgi:hypothetical protein
VVRHPTIYHVVFFFVRPVFQSFLIAVILHLPWGCEKALRDSCLEKIAGRAAGGEREKSDSTGSQQR